MSNQFLSQSIGVNIIHNDVVLTRTSVQFYDQAKDVTEHDVVSHSQLEQTIVSVDLDKLTSHIASMFFIIEPARISRRMKASMRWRSAAEVNAHQAVSAYNGLEITTAW